MKNCYINSAACISAQETFKTDRFLEEIIELQGNQCKAQYPDYKEFFSPVVGRRMSAAVKMGLAAAKMTLQNVNLDTPDAIITGTGMGCIEDTEKFLNSIIMNDEEYLTPTAFIQSTHNTVGAQIALSLNCKGYNNTFVQASNSFESALIDAQLLIDEGGVKNVLVGGIDELGAEFIDYVEMMEKKEDRPMNVPLSEGASFFLISNLKNKRSVRLRDLEIIHRITRDSVSHKTNDFLKKNGLKPNDIDAVILGKNGDAYDRYYKIIEDEFPENKNIITYKHLSGEYFTASAFGLWLGYNILKLQHIPSELLEKPILSEPIRNILLYNQYKGKGHSFVLISK